MTIFGAGNCAAASRRTSFWCSTSSPSESPVSSDHSATWVYPRADRTARAASLYEPYGGAEPAGFEAEDLDERRLDLV